MKAKREHRVALSSRAVDILNEMKKKRQSDFVFPGLRPGKPLSNMAFLQLLRRMDRPDITAHGFRSTFRDWAAEQTDYAPEDGGDVRWRTPSAAAAAKAAYRRGNLLEKRHRLMQARAEYCEPKIA